MSTIKYPKTGATQLRLSDAKGRAKWPPAFLQIQNASARLTLVVSVSMLMAFSVLGGASVANAADYTYSLNGASAVSYGPIIFGPFPFPTPNVGDGGGNGDDDDPPKKLTWVAQP